MTPAGRLAASASITASPHYVTTRRHSLYGTEDRIVLDLGARVWRVGFSGEGRPRAVLFGGGPRVFPLWALGRAPDPVAREEEARLLEARVQQRLRSVFHECVGHLRSHTSDSMLIPYQVCC
jgi:actin-related protein 10